MSRIVRPSVAFLVVMTAATTAVRAAALSVDDVIALKQLGYGDAEVKAEVQRTHSTFQLTPQDVAKLKQAGFGEAMIAFLRSPGATVAARKLTIDGIVAMAKAGKSVEEMLDAVAQATARPEVTIAAAVKLTRGNVHQAVTFALKGKPLTLADVKLLATKGLESAAWTKLVALVGVTKTALRPTDALALVRAGVPQAVIAALKQGRTPPAGPAVTPGTPPVTPAVRRKKPPISEVTKLTQPGVYEHAGRRFLIRFPADWQVLRTIDEGTLYYTFTPEKGETDPEKIKVLFQTLILPMGETSALQGKDAASILDNIVPLIRRAAPGMKKTGAVIKRKLGDLAAAGYRFEGTLKEQPGEFAIQFFVAEEDDLVYLVGCQAPRDEFSRLRPTFEKILADSRFGRIKQARPERSIEARHIVKKYKASVVSIVAETKGAGSTGSGFVISKDGYVITNWHVIWNRKAHKPHERFFVEWDDGLKRERQPAKLLGFRSKPSVVARFWGVDVALLKIAPGDYEPMPMTSLADVEPGDRVVTLGFPSRGLLEGVSLTITTGVVTRFNRGPDGKVVTIYTDAPTTHGSSGGPCVSLVTGGVIGLNTFGQDVSFEDRDANNLINYHGVVPINACFKEFPLVTALGMDPQGSTLDFMDAYGLSGVLVMQQSLNAADRLARRAVHLRPALADAQLQLANCQYAQALDTAAERGPEEAKKQLPACVATLKRALACDPTHEGSLAMMARAQMDAGNLAEAARYADQSIQADPEGWQGHYMAAQIALAQKQYDQAIQHATATKECVKGIMADPYILAGNAYYQKGDYEAGRQEFIEASRIHPANLTARLGVAQYHEHKKQIEPAVAEYRKILHDFRNNPVVLFRIGNCYFNAKQYEKAIPPLVTADRRFAKLGQIPPAECFLELAMANENLKKIDIAINWYAWFLQLHGKKSPYTQQIHIKVADHHASAKRVGLASAHLRLAKALGPNQELDKILGKIRLRPMTLDEIKAMLKMKYPIGLAARLIEASPMAFAVRTKEDVLRLNKEDGIPGPLIGAILTALKKHGTQQAGGGGGGTPPPPPNSLVGTWAAQGVNQMGGRWRMIIQFAANGQFAHQGFLNGQQVEASQGTYQVTQQTIVTRTTQGISQTIPYQLQGNALLMSITNLGGVRFTRQAGQ